MTGPWTEDTGEDTGDWEMVEIVEQNVGDSEPDCRTFVLRRCFEDETLRNKWCFSRIASEIKDVGE
jgi:hypothetical protein